MTRTNLAALTRVPLRLVMISMLGLMLLFRLWYGLLSDFWTDDELQVYLLGLKFYATGAFPFFGADITNGVQLFGALQGLLVGMPLYLLPAPETPIIFVNLLSFAALCFFAWYCTRLLPGVPSWFVWLWTMTAPWTLNFSAHVVNPSYVLAGSIVFFVAWFETCPTVSVNVIRASRCNLMMGAALTWIMQVHMSWVVLPGFVLASLYFQWRRGDDARKSVLYFLIGAAVPALLLAPTFWHYGFVGGSGNTGATVVGLNTGNLKNYFNPIEGILGRFLSLASFEAARFLGNSTAQRLAVLRAHAWMIPFECFAGNSRNIATGGDDRLVVSPQGNAVGVARNQIDDAGDCCAALPLFPVLVSQPGIAHILCDAAGRISLQFLLLGATLAASCVACVRAAVHRFGHRVSHRYRTRSAAHNIALP